MDLMWGIQARNRKPFKAAPLDSLLRSELQDRYMADREALAAFIGRDLGAWARKTHIDAQVLFSSPTSS
jgi:hypothetical protein